VIDWQCSLGYRLAAKNDDYQQGNQDLDLNTQEQLEKHQHLLLPDTTGILSKF